MTRPPEWTDEENEIVRRLYPVDIDACAAELPRRTREALVRHAAVIGVLHGTRPWDDVEDARLRKLWSSDLSTVKLAARMGRSQWGVWERGRALGLPLGVPQGCEFFTDACERAGFHGASLWRILRWANVATHATRVKPGAPRKRRYYVDPDDVDDAVAKFHATETIADAARRRGLSDNGLRRILQRAGLWASGGPRSSRHHRIESAAIDRVVAEWREQKEAA